MHRDGLKRMEETDGETDLVNESWRSFLSSGPIETDGLSVSSLLNRALSSSGFSSIYWFRNGIIILPYYRTDQLGFLNSDDRINLMKTWFVMFYVLFLLKLRTFS